MRVVHVRWVYHRSRGQSWAVHVDATRCLFTCMVPLFCTCHVSGKWACVRAGSRVMGWERPQAGAWVVAAAHKTRSPSDSAPRSQGPPFHCAEPHVAPRAGPERGTPLTVGKREHMVRRANDLYEMTSRCGDLELIRVHRRKRVRDQRGCPCHPGHTLELWEQGMALRPQVRTEEEGTNKEDRRSHGHGLLICGRSVHNELFHRERPVDGPAPEEERPLPAGKVQLAGGATGTGKYEPPHGVMHLDRQQWHRA